MSVHRTAAPPASGPGREQWRPAAAAPGKGAGLFMREGLKADLGKGIPRSLLRFLRAQTLRCAQGQGDVAKRIEMGEEAKILENEAQARSGIGEGSAPPSSASRPTRHRRSDDFPAPEGPSRQRCSPRARVRDRLRNSSSTPKALRAPVRVSTTGLMRGAPDAAQGGAPWPPRAGGSADTAPQQQ